LRQHHAAAPAEDGLADTALAKRLVLSVELARVLFRALKAQGRIVQTGPYLRAAGFVPKADPNAALARKLEALALAEEPVAPSLAELGIEGEAGKRLIARFAADGKVVRLGDANLMGRVAFEALSERVAELLQQRGTATVADVRDHLGIGRKIVVLLLEQMDTRKMTVRDGERRRLAAGSPLPSLG
jgi:selenocysteine-specific elongation factor